MEHIICELSHTDGHPVLSVYHDEGPIFPGLGPDTTHTLRMDNVRELSDNVNLEGQYVPGMLVRYLLLYVATHHKVELKRDRFIVTQKRTGNCIIRDMVVRAIKEAYQDPLRQIVFVDAQNDDDN
jgi:hypothetical protein